MKRDWKGESRLEDETVPSVAPVVEVLPRSLHCEPKKARLSGRDDN
jgi:hypothetical protein